MAADSTNRETVRDALLTLLSAALTGASNPAQAVYGYLVGDFQGQSPVVVVSSAGSQREPFQLKGQRNLLYFNIYVFVLFDDPDTGWDEDDAEDRIDLIEKEIADVVIDNRKTANWTHIRLEGRSTVDSMQIGGSEYRREVMTVRIETVDGYS